MNKNEIKALISFLSIYVGSALFLISILLYIYYEDEIKSLENTCSMQLSNFSMKIKGDILNSYMHHKKFIPKKLKNNEIKYALFDKNKKLIYSYLDGKELIDFQKKFYESGLFHFYVEELNEANIPIKYIVMQTCQGVEDRDRLKIYVAIALVLSAVFVGFIAYFLAKILLKPVREKVIDMDNFIKDSAHELNTPVAVLMTSVSMLKKGKNPSKMMKYILSSSKQISQIYNDIHFSAFENMNEQIEDKFNLKELVQDSVEYFNDISITKNIKIDSKLDDCFIKMDKTKTQKVVNNLISNAIKYSNKDSNILVKLEDSNFSVQDFGIGISKQQQDEIFKRYKRGNTIEGGFGIGLDIVKRVCKSYNLKLSLESIPNKGSTFNVDFSNLTYQ
ncbi:MAG: sensor histidine kinase [Halarcobacter sp.]